MSGTCEPTWKWTSLKQCASPAAFNISLAATRLVVSRPNFAFSPPLGDHLPEPLLYKRTRMPMCGSTPTSLRSADGLLQLLEFLDHDDDRLAELAAEQGDADESAVLVAVADDQALGVLVHRERGDQFRFAARFESEMKFLAGIDDLFDHLAQLVDLDRENAAVMVLVTELRRSRFGTRSSPTRRGGAANPETE